MSAEGATAGARRGLAGRVLGDRYRVVRMVSAGGSTLIADAEDTELDRPVTVKLVRPEIAESDEFRRKFVATMRAMAKLSHPNIAAVHDWGEEQIGRRTTAYAVVEHLAGGSLRDLFDRGRMLDPSQALMVGLEACRGLDFAHRKHLVHGELTPSKLVFGDDRRLRIVDFGLARLLGAADWREPSTVPTHVARYSSPEQALGQPIDGTSDVYSLALVLVEAVTGAVPFAARSTVATLSARVGRLMPVSADLGPLAAVLERAGRPDPSDRSTAAELGRALVRAAEKLPRPTPIPLLLSSPIDDDPERLRRPNDPTGGVRRPAPEPVVPLVPPVSAPPAAAPTAAPVEAPAPAPAPAERAADEQPTVATDPVEPTVPAAPEEHAAGASMGAAAVAAGSAGAAEAVNAAAGAGHDVSEVVEGEELDAVEPVEESAEIEDATVVGEDVPAPTGPPTVEHFPEDDQPGASGPIDGQSVAPQADRAPAPLPPPPAPGPAPSSPPSPVGSDAPAEVPGLDDPADPADPNGPDGGDPDDHAGDDAGAVRNELAALAQPTATSEARVEPAAARPASIDPVPAPADAVAAGTIPGPPSEPDEQPRRRRWLPWLVALAVVAALSGLGLLAYTLFKVPTHTVPELVGLDEAAARARTADFDWEIEIRRERSDEHPEPGEIIRTAPSAGEELAEDEPFLVVVSEGPEFRALEDLAGMTLIDAETRLAEQQLVPLPAVEEHHEEVPAGSVISWSVPSDTALGVGGQVLPGTEVQLVVSAGPAPRTIPTLVGLTVADATAALEAIQLAVAVAEPVFHDTIASGSVVSADPPDGTAGVARGTTVTITPSKGVDLVTVPPIVGLNLEQARAALNPAGLQVGSLLGNTLGVVVQASIAGQPVEAGQQFKRGSVVDLVLF